MEKENIAVNKHEVTGKIVKEIEFGENANGTQTAKFTVSCGTAEYPSYVDCIAYGKKAEELKEKGIQSGDFVELKGSGNFYKTEVGNKFYQLNVSGINKTESKEIKNSLQIRGNITQEPTIYETKNGGKIANINIAHNVKIGEEYKPMYATVTVFGKAAEFIEKNPDQYKIGNEVALKGSVKKEQYIKDDEKKHTVKINANYIEVSNNRNKVVDKENKVEETKVEEKKETKTEKKKVNNESKKTSTRATKKTTRKTTAKKTTSTKNKGVSM